MSERVTVGSADIHERDDVVFVDMMYPRNNQTSQVQVGICDVRAADDIRIHYDFERDGWVIEQASTFEWDMDDEVCDPDWQEVAFVQAWGRKGGQDGHSSGLTWKDVDLNRAAYVNCVTLARRAQDGGDEVERLGMIEMARRHRDLADRIAALLPPRETT